MTKFRNDGNSGGIWQKVELIATGAIKIDQIKVYPKIVDEDGSAIISVDLEVNQPLRRAGGNDGRHGSSSPRTSRAMWPLTIPRPWRSNQDAQ